MLFMLILIGYDDALVKTFIAVVGVYLLEKRARRRTSKTEGS